MLEINRHTLAFYCAALCGFLWPLNAAEGIREVTLELRDLVYAPYTQKLYATSPEHPDGLLQIDPTSGGLIQVYEIGTNCSVLALDSANGIWVGLNGESAIRRFNLETGAAETKIALPPESVIEEIVPSKSKTNTLAVSVRNETFFIDQGVVLPESVPLTRIAFDETFVYGSHALDVLHPIYQASVETNGLRLGKFNYWGGLPTRREVYDGKLHSDRLILNPDLSQAGAYLNRFDSEGEFYWLVPRVPPAGNRNNLQLQFFFYCGRWNDQSGLGPVEQ